MATFDMQEVNIQSIDGDCVLWQSIQSILSRKPVVLIGPVATKLPVVVDRYALRPVTYRL